jgi:hypothetical protein
MVGITPGRSASGWEDPDLWALRPGGQNVSVTSAKDFS